MNKHINRFLNLLLISALLFTNCRKEEIVIVYSKISTVEISNITSTSSQVEGLIEELTETTHNEYGVCWSTIKDPTVYDEKVLQSGTASLGSFTVDITGLEPSTTYHVRAFVIDNKKYIYGEDLTFKTLEAALPVVSTFYVTDITSVSATSGGNVTDEGDMPVSAKGICFDTIASPTIQDRKTIDGWSTGSFESKLINLKPETTYYLRAYAISDFGVSYGSEQSFTTKEPVFYFIDNFDDDSNPWFTGTNPYGSSDITEGEYVCSYQREGYIWRTWLNFPDFVDVANSKDFEINIKVKNNKYNPLAVNPDMVCALIWDCGNSAFKYFAVKKNVSNTILRTTTYYYTIGEYDGSYTTWQDTTSFEGSEYNLLTIKKGNGYYYFFINDTQVFKHSYTSITNQGVGFYIANATMYADYISIEQKGDKKSDGTDLMDLIPDSNGKNDIIISPGYH